MADFKTDFAIHLDGNKLQGEEAGAILGIRVFQTRSGASAFEVIVSDPDLKWQSKPTFTDCKEVKIELGEAGKLKQVFDGEVTAWRTELERSGPTVLVLRGLDRSHRMMRAKKTRTYADASPIDCARQIAGAYGLTAKTRAGAPPPVKMFRFQANQTDFEFLRQMADLEGYMFFIEGSELHFERPQIPSNDDAEFSFGQEVKTFLPVANFRKPSGAVEVGAWDVSGKEELSGKAQTGDELWSVPGVKPGAQLAKFSSSKPEVSLVESQVGTQEHADTVAKAALTKRAMQFITAEVEVQGNPAVKPGALVNIKKVGEYSGHYLVTEANHFYDSAGYNCIFYVARDKWGNSSTRQQQQAARQQQPQPAEAKGPTAEPESAAEAKAAAEEEAPAEEEKDDDTKTALLVEVEDAHFRFDSAVFLPQPADDTGADAPPGETIAGLDVLKTIYLRVKEFPGEKLLVAGHTDTKGRDAYNLPLSEKRAGAVEALLRGDDGAFAGISQAQHQAKDVQQILAWAAVKRGWDCDPGAIDGQIGDGTNAALKSFKKHCNEDLGTSLAANAKIDEPFWRAVFALYMAELAKLLEVEVGELDGFRSSLGWVDDAKHCVGCGESWPIEGEGKDEFRSATNRRVEVLFFQAGQEPKLDCHPAPAKCEKAQCALYPPDGKFKRTPLPVHPGARPQSTPKVRVPEQPGSATRIAPDGLHAYVVRFKKGSSDLDSVTHFVVRGGQFQLPAGAAPVPIDCDREAFFYFSHRGDLADDASARPGRFAQDRSGLPLVGPLTVPSGPDAELQIDLWQQNDWVLFRARQIDGAGPEAVKMAEQRQDYTVGHLSADKSRFFVFGTPHDKDVQERWDTALPPIDLVRLSAPSGVPLLVGTLSALPGGKAKLLAFRNAPSAVGAAGTSGPIVVATWNELLPSGSNVEIAGLHRYDTALVAKLSALKTSDQGNAAVDALPDPPARFFLPGDMNWQDQGQTNNCGAYSFSTAMNYWFPYTNNAGAKNGAFYSDTSRVPSVVNGARTPANIVDAASKFALNGVDHDAEKLDKARALKLLKLWVSAGVPVLVLVKEDSAAGFFDRMVSYHWKTVVGWDGQKLFMNNSGGDQEYKTSLRKSGFDYEHGPEGNDMDPIDTHYEKWRLAGGDVVDLFTSVDECTFIPLYPKAAEYAGDRPE